MSKQAFDRKMEALDAIRAAPASAETLAQLSKALKDRNNYLVSKAAKLAGEFGSKTLIPDLLAAFERFMTDPLKSDPQCWAKQGIVKALKDLGHDDPAVYIRGIKHFQLEPSFGRPVDSAATLRATCGLALPACSVDRISILTPLVDLLADPEKNVRVDGVRAVAQMPGHDSILLIRLKALCGDAEYEVVGQCLLCLLEMSPRDEIQFVAGFLQSKDRDTQFEAISALGTCHQPEAVAILKDAWDHNANPEIREAILVSLGASRDASAVEFLMNILDDARPEYALIALKALASGRFRDEVRDRAAAIVQRRDEEKLTAAWKKF